MQSNVIALIVSIFNFSFEKFSSLLARSLESLAIDIELENKRRFEIEFAICNDEEFSLLISLEIFEIEQTLHNIIDALSLLLHAISWSSFK